MCGKEREVQPTGWKIAVDADIRSKCEISFFHKMFYCFFQMKYKQHKSSNHLSLLFSSFLS